MVTTTSKKLNQFLKKLLHMSRDEGFGSFSAHRVDTRGPCLAKDVPAGCLPVYVGQERRRFVIPTTHLSNNIFRALLAKSEEEYGLRCDGGLQIACAPDVFEHFLWWLEGDGSHYNYSEDIIKHSCSGRFG